MMMNETHLPQEKVLTILKFMRGQLTQVFFQR